LTCTAKAMATAPSPGRPTVTPAARYAASNARSAP
jgi:hypothetical protein